MNALVGVELGNISKVCTHGKARRIFRSTIRSTSSSVSILSSAAFSVRFSLPSSIRQLHGRIDAHTWATACDDTEAVKLVFETSMPACATNEAHHSPRLQMSFTTNLPVAFTLAMIVCDKKP